MDSFVIPRCACVLVWALAAGQAAAQAMGDPTQPPAILAAPGGAVAPDPSAPVALQLQSILVSREAGGRRVAVINGELVRPGAKIGDAVVISVNENTVVLRRGKNKETLRLFPKQCESNSTCKN
jgi:MSHA biogenesis protein MshK